MSCAVVKISATRGDYVEIQKGFLVTRARAQLPDVMLLDKLRPENQK